MVKRSGRVYWRQQGGVKRAYGDFRDFADVGGRLEALKAPGTKLATTDKDIAAQVAATRVKDLEARRRNRALLGVERQTTLGAYSQYHLEQKAKSGKFADHYMTGVERHLTEALQFIGDRDLTSISTHDVQRYLTHLRKLPAKRTTERRTSTTQADGVSTVEWNGSLKDLQKAKADVLLGSRPHYHPLLATYLLTGGRKSPRYVPVTETAKLIRKALSSGFPGFRFSVRSRSYAVGASIDVGWTDGPTASAVDDVIQPFAGSRFDGMIDLKSNVTHWLTPAGEAYLAHDPGTQGSRGIFPQVSRPIAPHDEAERVRFGADFVFARRRYSEGFLRPLGAYVADARSRRRSSCRSTLEPTHARICGLSAIAMTRSPTSSTNTHTKRARSGHDQGSGAPRAAGWPLRDGNRHRRTGRHQLRRASFLSGGQTLTLTRDAPQPG